MTTTERTELGQEIEIALSEVLAHVRGEQALSCRIVDDPCAERIVAVRKRLKLSRRKFCGALRPGCAGGPGLGTGPSSSGPCGSRAADGDRPRTPGPSHVRWRRNERGCG